MFCILINWRQKFYEKGYIHHVAIDLLLLANYRLIDCNHLTHFVQWRCNILVKQSQTNYSYLAHSDKNCSWAGHSCPSKQLGYTFIPVNLPQSIKRMFVAKLIKQHWIKHIVSRTKQRFFTTCKSKIFIKQFFFTVLQYLTFIKQSYNDNHRNKSLCWHLTCGADLEATWHHSAFY